jgi:hypothetical protein
MMAWPWSVQNYVSTIFEQPTLDIIEDCLYCSYLGGECFYREEMVLKTSISNFFPTSEAASSLSIQFTHHTV